MKNSYLLSVIEKFSVWIDGVNFSHFKISTLSKKCSLSACPGYETYDGSNFSEDCLYMNIYKPSGAQNLPIFIWIHGGGFVDGQRLGSKFEILFNTQAVGMDSGVQFSLRNFIEDILQPTSSKM